MTSREIVSTSAAPAAIGPYSQAVRAGDFVFLCGQIGLDPETGALAPGGIEAETDQVMKNLAAVLEASGVSFADVVKTTVYLIDLAHFTTVNGIYATHFSENPPARSLVQVAALPRGASVEIDAIACVPAPAVAG